MQTEIIYFNFKGGIISPGYLKQLLEIAAEAHVKELRFGLRQQLIMEVDADKFTAFASLCVAKEISFHKAKDPFNNIVSSYAGVNIFTGDSWLSEGIYKDVFDLFKYEHSLKINICDSQQTFTPFFSGHLNWISSRHAHYWYLYLRFPGTGRIFCWPELVYTNDIAAVSRQLEKFIISIYKQNHLGDHPETDILFEVIKRSITYISMPLKEKLTFPAFHLPYYEGFNKEGDSYWLGVYRRDEIFSVDFMIDICNICLQSRIGQIYVTCWKSLIIKGITIPDRNRWDQVLGNYRINVRHAANELNWQVEDMNEDGLILKRHVIRYFDKEDVRTYGLCFAVKTLPSSDMFGSVVIRRQEKKNTNRLKSNERFDILYKKDFNPNGSDLILFRENVEKDHLGPYLASVCKFFYNRENEKTQLKAEIKYEEQEVKKHEPAALVYQCRSCLSVYDHAIEDDENQVAAGTPFNELPEEYHCLLCGAGKASFLETEESSLYLQS